MSAGHSSAHGVKERTSGLASPPNQLYYTLISASCNTNFQCEKHRALCAVLFSYSKYRLPGGSHRALQYRDWPDNKDSSNQKEENHMALEWLKTILGDAYTPEIDAAVSQEIGKGFVAKADFNEKNTKVKELTAEVGQLRGTIEARDQQLEDLKKSTGDNAELQKQIDTLTQKNKDDKAAYDKELAKIKLLAAAEAELTAAGSKNNTAVMAVLGDFLENAAIVDGKVASKVNGESVTLAARIDAMKKDTATDFMFGAATQYNGWKPGESGDGKKPETGKKPSEMSYSELTEFLAANPDAKLD